MLAYNLFIKFAVFPGDLAGCNLKAILLPSELKILFLEGRKVEGAGDWEGGSGGRDGAESDYLPNQHMFTREHGQVVRGSADVN